MMLNEAPVEPQDLWVTFSLYHPVREEAALATEELMLMPSQFDKLDGEWCWSLATREHVPVGTLSNHLDWLLTRLLPRTEALLNLQYRPQTRMTLTCFTSGWSKTPDLEELSPASAQMDVLGLLNLDLDVENIPETRG